MQFCSLFWSGRAASIYRDIFFGANHDSANLFFGGCEKVVLLRLFSAIFMKSGTIEVTRQHKMPTQVLPVARRQLSDLHGSINTQPVQAGAAAKRLMHWARKPNPHVFSDVSDVLRTSNEPLAHRTNVSNSVRFSGRLTQACFLDMAQNVNP